MVLLALSLSGCELNHYSTLANNLPRWQVDFEPKYVCINDSIQVKYRFGNNCPADYDCSALYPNITVASPTESGLFPAGVYHITSYIGEIESAPIRSESPIPITVTSDPYLVGLRDDGMTSYVVPGPPDVVRRYPVGYWHFIYTSPVDLLVDPIDSGVPVMESIVFNGQCAGHTPIWTPVSFAVDHVRSRSVHIRRLCNRDLRWVTFTANFSSGLPAQQVMLMPDECRDIVSEAPPAMITSLTASPNTALPGEIGPRCSDVMGSSAPAPIRAEVTLGCQ